MDTIFGEPIADILLHVINVFEDLLLALLASLVHKH